MPIIPPRADEALHAWAVPFVARLAEDPQLYGHTPQAVAEMAELLDRYAELLLAVADGRTRTSGKTAAKNEAKIFLRDALRHAVKVVNTIRTLPGERRVELGLALPRATRAAVPRPTTRPLNLLSPAGVLCLRDESCPTRRGKPAGALGAYVYTKLTGLNEAAPSGLADATFADLAIATRFRVPVPPNSRGKVLHVLTQWVSTSGHRGPVSAVASTLLVG